MLKKSVVDEPVLAEGSSSAMPICSSVMAAMIAQYEDRVTVCALVQSAMSARGAIAGAVDDLTVLHEDAVGELLRGRTC
jgi:hypothetical protein